MSGLSVRSSWVENLQNAGAADRALHQKETFRRIGVLKLMESKIPSIEEFLDEFLICYSRIARPSRYRVQIPSDMLQRSFRSLYTRKYESDAVNVSQELSRRFVIVSNCEGLGFLNRYIQKTRQVLPSRVERAEGLDKLGTLNAL